MNASADTAPPAHSARRSGASENDRSPLAASEIILRSEYLLLPAARAGRSKAHRSLAEPDPGEHAAHEPVALGHGEKAVERFTVDQAEIAGVARRRDVAQPRHEAIEEIRRRPLEPAFAFARDALGRHDVVALLPFGDHREHDLGRVLQIPVHYDDRVSGGVIEPDGDCDLMTEIARQLDQPVALVGARLGLDHDRAGIVRSVVDDDHLARRVERSSRASRRLSRIGMTASSLKIGTTRE